MMRIVLMKICILILIVSMLLFSCSTGNDETSSEDDNNVTVVNAEEGEATNVEEAEDDEATNVEEAEEDEVTNVDETEDDDVDISLLDRALLERIKFNWPDSYMMISTEDTNGVITTITTYQKGYSKREEHESEGETTVEIYNADKGITYEYTSGDTTGIMTKDDEYDIEALEEEKALEGKSLMAMFDEFYEDAIIEAKITRMLGRKAVEIEISSASQDEGEEVVPWLFVIDYKYAVALKADITFGDGYYLLTETTEIEFNIDVKDSLFDPPTDIVFNE